MSSLTLRLLLGLTFGATALVAAETGSTLIYIGTYTAKKSQGIYLTRLNPATGALSTPELAVAMVNPSWLTIHPTRKYLYACGESGPYKGGGAISGFTIQPDGKLAPINSQEPGGNGPCHLAISATGNTIVVSNYGGGSVTSLKIAADGSLAPSAWIDQHPTLAEKQQPHAHACEFDLANRFVLSCDAGLDRIYSYRYDAASGALTANDPPFVATTANTHPRHLTFSPDGKYCYNIDEASMSVTAFRYEASQGSLTQIQSLSTLPADFVNKGGSTAELIMHPSGKFLYGSNRGHNSIVGYRVAAQTGLLTLIGQTSTQGEIPRSFGIDPTGQWMVVGNQNSDTVVQFKIDAATGELKPTGAKLEVGAPVCFKFLEVKP